MAPKNFSRSVLIHVKQLMGYDSQDRESMQLLNQTLFRKVTDVCCKHVAKICQNVILSVRIQNTNKKCRD